MVTVEKTVGSKCRYGVYLFACLTIAGIFQNATAQEILTVEAEVSGYQKDIVARLSGAKPIQSVMHLTQRASPSERQFAANYLSAELEALGWTLANHKYKARNSNLFLDLYFLPSKGTNVSAYLPSTAGSEEFIIFGAHYDSERGSPGAIDNATGVALCLALVKKLNQLKVRNKNLRVVFFDQEEDDEVGSGAFVRMLQDNNVKVHSVHILDMMGWDANDDRAVDFQTHDPSLRHLYTNLAEKYGIPHKVVQGGASDNRQFQAAGYKTLATFESFKDSTPFIHQPGDTYDTVDFDYLASTTQLIFLVFKTLLNE